MIRGVCAGVAEYFGRPPWEIRLYTVLGLIFMAQVVIAGYFIIWLVMEKKPYYRRVTDRFAEAGPDGPDVEPEAGADLCAADEPELEPGAALALARSRFSALERRLRRRESHVTSSRVELQRVCRKMADAAEE